MKSLCRLVLQLNELILKIFPFFLLLIIYSDSLFSKTTFFAKSLYNEENFGNFLPISNTNNVNDYREYCFKNNLTPHPARMPQDIVEFFIKFLTKKKSIVLDPF